MAIVAALLGGNDPRVSLALVFTVYRLGYSGQENLERPVSWDQDGSVRDGWPAGYLAGQDTSYSQGTALMWYRLA